MDRPRIVFFPGLACDERILEPHRSLNAAIEPQPWLTPARGESLAAYAQRYVERIDTSTPFYLAGISLGGMIAQELALRIRPRGLILIASCRSRTGLPWVNRLLAYGVVFSPDWFVQVGKLAMPRIRRVFGIETEEQVELFRAMLRDAPPVLIKRCLRAIAAWPGVRADLLLGIPTLQLHGDRDHILPPSLAGPITDLIPGAGHALNVTHAARVNATIDRWLGRIGANPD